MIPMALKSTGRVRFEDVQDHIRNVRRRLDDFSPAADQINAVIDTHIQHQFDAGGDPKWTPRKRPYPWQILQKSGRMRRAVSRAAKSARLKLLGRAVVISYAGIFYATRYTRFHLTSTRFMAARVFSPPQSPLTTDEEAAIVDIVDKHIGLIP